MNQNKKDARQEPEIDMGFFFGTFRLPGLFPLPSPSPISQPGQPRLTLPCKEKLRDFSRCTAPAPPFHWCRPGFVAILRQPLEWDGSFKKSWLTICGPPPCRHQLRRPFLSPPPPTGTRLILAARTAATNNHHALCNFCTNAYGSHRS